MNLSSLLSALLRLTDAEEIDLFAREVPARGLLSYLALAEQFAPTEYAAWSAANLDDAAAADSVEVYPYDHEAHGARCKAAGRTLDAALRAVPSLGATLREAVLTRCRLTGADPAPALALLDAEGL